MFVYSAIYVTAWRWLYTKPQTTTKKVAGPAT